MASYSCGLAASSWSFKQNRQFEEGLAKYDRDTPDRWHNIARLVDGKSAEDVKRYYEDLVKDINNIENDKVPIPNYRAMPNARGSYANEQRLMKNLKLH